MEIRDNEFRCTDIRSIRPRQLPGYPVVRNLHFHCCGLGSIPGQGAQILQAAQLEKFANTYCQFLYLPQHGLVRAGTPALTRGSHFEHCCLSLWKPGGVMQ